MARRLSIAILFAAACTKPAGASRKGADGPVVATFGDHVVTVDELQHELNSQSPFIRSRYQSAEKKKEFLDQMIRFELLADEAQKAGFDQDPDVQKEFKRAMIKGWTSQKFNDKDGMSKIPPEDLQAYYDAHKDDYQRPERLRVQIVKYKLGSSESATKAEATKALKEVSAKMKKNDIAAFAELARTRSDDAASKGKGGDLDFRTHDELAKLFGEPVAAAADALKAPNDLSDIVSGTDGFYLLRLEARQPAFNRTLDQVKATLQARLWNERRKQMYEDFVKHLRDTANVKIDEAELAKVDANQPPNLSAGNMSGAPPMASPHAFPPGALGRAMPHPMPGAPPMMPRAQATPPPAPASHP